MLFIWKCLLWYYRPGKAVVQGQRSQNKSSFWSLFSGWWWAARCSHWYKASPSAVYLPGQFSIGGAGIEFNLKNFSFSGCDHLIQTFVTSKVVEYQIVQNTPSSLPFRAKETVISRKKCVMITSTVITFVKWEIRYLFVSFPSIPASERWQYLELPLEGCPQSLETRIFIFK